MGRSQSLKNNVTLCVLFGLSLLYFSLSSSFAGTGGYLDPDRQFDYANDCFANQEFIRAADEFRRFLYFFPEDTRVELARVQMGVSYFKAGEYQTAIHVCQKNIDGFQDTNLAYQSYFIIARSHMALEQSGNAILTLNNLLLLANDTDIQDQAHFELGWIYLELRWPLKYGPDPGALSQARLHFQKISLKNSEKYHVEELLNGVDQLGGVSQKNPKVAGSLSIIPGAGQVYCKRYQDGLTAFLLNGILALVAYEAFDNENYALGSLVAFVGLGFYAGNIYGAVSSAHKYNRDMGRHYVEELKEEIRSEMRNRSNDKKISLSFRYHF